MATVLVLESAGGLFGVASANVREVVRAAALSPAIGWPAGLEGLLNLRGRVIPVVDLAWICQLQQSELHPADFFVVIEGKSDLLFGARSTAVPQITDHVDGATESTQQMEFGSTALVDDRLVTMLDVNYLCQRFCSPLTGLQTDSAAE